MKLDAMEDDIRDVIEKDPNSITRGIAQQSIAEQLSMILDIPNTTLLQNRINSVVTNSRFLTHDAGYQWQKTKKRFLRPLGDYFPNPVAGYEAIPYNQGDLEIFLDDEDMMPWDDPDLKEVFQAVPE
jgi:hypothetical protein